MYNFKLFEKLLAKKYFTSSFLHHSSAQPGHAYNIPEKSIEKNIKIKRLEIMASSKEADWEKLARSIEKRLSGVCEVSIVNRNTEESMRFCKLLTNYIPPNNLVPHVALRQRPFQELKLELNHYYALGIRQLFIVEGDPVYVQSKIMPDNQILNLKPQTYNPDYLIDAIKLAKNMNFNVSAACYPEGHPLAPSLEASIERALEKQAAGCTQLIGQISFTFPPFDSFLTKAGACGLKIPIIMSIMPSVPNKEFLYNFCFRNNISLPHELKIATELERIEYLWHLIKDKNLDICYASLNRFSAFDQWVNKEKNFEIDNIPSISYGFK